MAGKTKKQLELENQLKELKKVCDEQVAKCITLANENETLTKDKERLETIIATPRKEFFSIEVFGTKKGPVKVRSSSLTKGETVFYLKNALLHAEEALRLA